MYKIQHLERLLSTCKKQPPHSLVNPSVLIRDCLENDPQFPNNVYYVCRLGFPINYVIKSEASFEVRMTILFIVSQHLASMDQIKYC